jgi:cyclohexa-1,5-dienecarbonyl-CoA hydratase
VRERAGSSPITLEIEDGIGRVTINRPPLNILDIETLQQLNESLRSSAVAAVRVLVLTSALPVAFSAGVDVRDHRIDRLDAMLSEVRENTRLLLSAQPITIAAIRGTTLGGGAELACLCDLVIAADDLTFGFPEINLAAFPPIAAAILPELVAWHPAVRLLLGETLDASAAQHLGLVTRVVPADQLEGAVSGLAGELAARSAVAIRAATSALRGQRAPAVLQRLDAAIAIYRASIARSHDAEEGITAFLEKRAPAWSHR